MLTVFFVIVLDLIGFGIMVPILAYYVQAMGASAALATMLMALWSIALFFSTPILGRISDYYGRKPVLMLSMMGATLGYLLLASAESLWMVAFARIIGGAMAGNIAAAQAYITDITTVENRSKGLGLIGAAFGIGFILGPTLGSLLAGENFEDANFVLPALVSALMSALAFVAVWLLLPESLSEESRAELRAQPRVGRLDALRQVINRPMIVAVLGCGLLYNTSAGLFESIFPLWVAKLGVIDGPRGLAPILLAGGFALVVVQGLAMGPLSRRFGEINLLRGGAVFYVLGMALMIAMGAAGSFGGVIAAMGLQSGAAALLITSAQSLASMTASGSDRGLVMGVYGSMGTLGRIIGTTTTGSLFMMLHVHSPLIGSILVISILFVLAGYVKPAVADKA